MSLVDYVTRPAYTTLTSIYVTYLCLVKTAQINKQNKKHAPETHVIRRVEIASTIVTMS